MKRENLNTETLKDVKSKYQAWKKEWVSQLEKVNEKLAASYSSFGEYVQRNTACLLQSKTVAENSIKSLNYKIRGINSLLKDDDEKLQNTLNNLYFNKVISDNSVEALMEVLN